LLDVEEAATGIQDAKHLGRQPLLRLAREVEDEGRGDGRVERAGQIEWWPGPSIVTPIKAAWCWVMASPPYARLVEPGG
jgi:hypothetical protein